MLDDEFHISKTAKAALVSIVCSKFPEHKTSADTDRSLIELSELMRTLDIETGSKYIQNRKQVDAGTILGTGKLEEIASDAMDEGCTLLVFDFELTASQIRNIKSITGLAVVDRCHVILEIFSEHARTKDAKIQIEISRLQYVLPRLAGFWTHLDRQKGGIGVRSGEGEQQIELDRRIIRERIEYYKRELKDLVKSRDEQRKKRQTTVVTTALVGYTNAGKSSLMNRMCKVDILEENKLFATLDSTYRTLNPDTKPPMVLIDTVGFISNLPNILIDGFKTTLESAMEADLLVIVCDISDPHFKKQLEVTHEVLKDLKVDHKDTFIVFNKKDILNDPVQESIIKRAYPNSFVVSSFDPDDMSSLREYIVQFFLDKQAHYDLFIPYDGGMAHSLVVSKTNVLNSTNHETGIFYRIRVPDFIFHNLGIQKYILAPDDPIRSQLDIELEL